MGFFSGVKNFAKKAAGKVSSTAKKAYKKGKEKIKKAANKVKNKASKTWSTFTGKDKAKKAKKIFNEAKEKYEKEKNKFDKKAKKYIEEINYLLESINEMKKKLYNNYFVKFGNITSRVTNFNMKTKEILDDMIEIDFKAEKLRTKNEIIKIDFNQNKVKNNLKAVFTLGFYTRKKAKESLEKAKEEKHKVKMNIEKMEAEIKRLKTVKQAIVNIKNYFTDLISICKKLLERMSYSLDSLRKKHLILSKPLIKGKLNFRNLPNAHIKTFEITTTLIKILANMSQKKYVDVENLEIIKKDIDDTKKQLKKSNIKERALKAA